MARPLRWSDVRGGALAAILITVIAVLILKYSQLGRLRGETFSLTAFMSEARGVLVGSEVWLSGQKIGKIVAIKYRAPQSADTTERVEIDMELLEKYRGAMRHDAIAQIRNGGTIIGAPVVYLTAGTVAAREMRPGDTLRSKPQVDVETATGKFGAAAHELPYIINNVKEVTAQLKGTQGTVGALLNTPTGFGGKELARTRAQVGQLRARLTAGQGPFNTDVREEMMLRARGVMARVDSVRTLVASPNTSLGRMRRDSTLLATVGDLRTEIGVVRTMIDSSNGTAGRALHDSALTVALGGAQKEMAALFADMKKHPLRYIRF